MIERNLLGMIFIYIGSFGISDLILQYLDIKNIVIKMIYYLFMFSLGLYFITKI